jgi:hypothetical protein
MMRIIHFCTAIAIAIIVVGINTPLAHADSFSASASVATPGCSQSSTITEPGSINLSCGSAPLYDYATFSANLGQSGELLYFGAGGSGFTTIGGRIGVMIDITGEITAHGNSGNSIITFGFAGSENQAAPVGCSLTFDGQITNCAVESFGYSTEDLEFVVQNGQTYNYDLEVGGDQNLEDFPSEASFQYSSPYVMPEPVPEPVSLILLLSGFAPLAFKRKLS